MPFRTRIPVMETDRDPGPFGRPRSPSMETGKAIFSQFPHPSHQKVGPTGILSQLGQLFDGRDGECLFGPGSPSWRRTETQGLLGDQDPRRWRRAKPSFLNFPISPIKKLATLG